MMKRKEIIEILKQINHLIIENNGPTSIFIAGKNSKKVNISALSVDKDFIIVTTGKYLFKRKYRINRNEL
ncbi:hypothetical protein G9F71_026710 [Clostridium sp. FP2]|uniref:hypothetical protein n=1 Tax=Clostridium sp. FP2 TaxID=2724481 RepID=UPI0013E9098A|nr:hypothetical protein [Clostridium sp. FP2]MBZ9626398.1 hypothetical protein [Clostridium sp. FP2]